MTMMMNMTRRTTSRSTATQRTIQQEGSSNHNSYYTHISRVVFMIHEYHLHQMSYSDLCHYHHHQ